MEQLHDRVQVDGLVEGRAIHFVPPQGQGYRERLDRHCIAGVVVRVWPQQHPEGAGYVNLVVFPDGSNDFTGGGAIVNSLVRWETSVHHSPELLGARTWHFVNACPRGVTLTDELRSPTGETTITGDGSGEALPPYVELVTGERVSLADPEPVAAGAALQMAGAAEEQGDGSYLVPFDVTRRSLWCSACGSQLEQGGHLTGRFLMCPNHGEFTIAPVVMLHSDGRWMMRLPDRQQLGMWANVEAVDQIRSREG